MDSKNRIKWDPKILNDMLTMIPYRKDIYNKLDIHDLCQFIIWMLSYWFGRLLILNSVNKLDLCSILPRGMTTAAVTVEPTRIPWNLKKSDNICSNGFYVGMKFLMKIETRIKTEMETIYQHTFFCYRVFTPFYLQCG